MAADAGVHHKMLPQIANFALFDEIDFSKTHVLLLYAVPHLHHIPPTLYRALGRPSLTLNQIVTDQIAGSVDAVRAVNSNQEICKQHDQIQTHKTTTSFESKKGLK